jgi:hypothetical protein
MDTYNATTAKAIASMSVFLSCLPDLLNKISLSTSCIHNQQSDIRGCTPCRFRYPLWAFQPVQTDQHRRTFVCCFRRCWPLRDSWCLGPQTAPQSLQWQEARAARARSCQWEGFVGDFGILWFSSGRPENSRKSSRSVRGDISIETSIVVRKRRDPHTVLCRRYSVTEQAS